MAIFSYSVGVRVSRDAGQSAVRAAAYQARERLQDERTGNVYNFRPRGRAGIEPRGEPKAAGLARGGIAAASAYVERGPGYDAGRKPALFVGLYAPKDAPDWCRGRENIEQFWSRAEVAERRSDAQIAERIIIALPHELSLKQNIWLLQDHVKEFTRRGRVVQVAVHAPEHGDGRNIHAHLLVSTRGVDEHGFKPSKAAEQQQRYLHRREYVQGLRARWADATNRHLARHGHAARIDHRTLEGQGIAREPTIHLGPGDSRRERQSGKSRGGELNRAVVARNGERQQAKAEITRLEAKVIDLDKARAERTTERAAKREETERELSAPGPANTASGGQQKRQEPYENDDRNLFWRVGGMLRSAFETALDWIAPVAETPDPHPQPQRQPLQAQQAPPEVPWEEQLRGLAEYHRRIGYLQPQRDRDQADSPLYERYKAERDAAYQAREAAVRDVHERFAAYAQDLRGFYDLRFEQEKHSGMPGPMRHDAMELLSAMRRGDRRATIRLEREQVNEIRRTYPLPDWGGWLKREAEKGARDAARALARHEAREAERNRDRDDDGRGTEP